MSLTTPIAESLRIVLLGARNAGKSSLMNNLFERPVSIISDTPGTTTDPVTRKMELSDLGPVAVTDTAGLDDVGLLGGFRIEKSREFSKIADICLLVTPGDREVTAHEQELAEELKKSNKQILCALTFADRPKHPSKEAWAKSFPHVFIDNVENKGFKELRQKLISLKSNVAYEISPLEGLVNEGDLVVLVTPIDLAAPKGRLILPQVETIRDLLDKDCASLVVKERELKFFYDNQKVKPKLVVTDSQAFHKVAADIPEDQALTSFSILFARKKGDLAEFIRGIKAMKNVPSGGKVLVMESCAHHRQADDIGTVKIPRLFKQLVRPDVTFDFSRKLPEEENLSGYNLVIHCASCMLSRQQMTERLSRIGANNIPITNYGLFLGWVNGLLPRALEPFPELYKMWEED